MKIKLIFILCSVIILFSCSSGKNEHIIDSLGRVVLSIYDNSTLLMDIREFNMRQFSVESVVEYPDLQIFEKYGAELRNNGFIECDRNNQGWETFLDSSSGELVLKFRIVQHYYEKQNNIFATVMSFYDSKDIDDKSKPDSNKQYTHVLQYVFEDIEQRLMQMGVRCNL